MKRILSELVLLSDVFYNRFMSKSKNLIFGLGLSSDFLFKMKCIINSLLMISVVNVEEEESLCFVVCRIYTKFSSMIFFKITYGNLQDD